MQELLGPNGLIFAVKGENDEVHILWGGRLFYTYRRNNEFEKKLCITLLARLGVLQKTIAELCDVERHTVRNIVSFYDKEGPEGLRDYKVGRRAVPPELQRFVIQKYVELNGTRGYQNMILEAIEKKVDEGLFFRNVSRGEVQKIIRLHKQEMNRRREEERQEDVHQQKPKDKEQREAAGKEHQEAESKQLELKEEEKLCVQHGGAAAVIPLLAEFGLKALMPQESQTEHRRYSNAELAVSFTALNAARLVEVEQDFKLVGSYQMGGIIGRRRLPSLSLYRERIPQIVDGMDMPQIMLNAAERAKVVFGTTRIVYVDGHFMPYYGEAATLYGYNTQRRLAMPGREYITVHDETGVPIYAALSDEYRKFQYYLEQIDARVRAIYGVGEKQILEVFDRGGYSKEFCVEIDAHICFICWRSDAREVPPIEAKEWKKVVVSLQANEYGQLKNKRFEAWERRRTLEAAEKQGRFRELWIKRGKKISPALSNDFSRPVEELVAALVQRWGRQENGFKELKAHGIDRIHSYRKESYCEDYLYARGLEQPQVGVCHKIGNPKIRELNKELGTLRQLKHRLDRGIAKAQGGKKKQQQLRQLKMKAAGVSRRIATLLRKRKELPRKVLMMDRIEEEGIVRLCDSKKLFFDWLKMNAIWARKVLVGVVKPYYKDFRDVNKFVSWLLRSRTYATRRAHTLFVEFAPQRSQNMLAALQALCAFLNSKPSFDLDISFTKIHFRVGDEH
jgi:hypothetical protein